MFLTKCPFSFVIRVASKAIAWGKVVRDNVWAYKEKYVRVRGKKDAVYTSLLIEKSAYCKDTGLCLSLTSAACSIIQDCMLDNLGLHVSMFRRDEASDLPRWTCRLETWLGGCSAGSGGAPRPARLRNGLGLGDGGLR